MVWSEYTNEQYYEQVHMDEVDDIPAPYELLNFEDWVDWYEPHISNMWKDMTIYRQDAGIARTLGTHLDFWDFAKFMYNTSNQHAIPIK